MNATVGQLLLLGLLSVAFAGCVRNSDRHQTEGQTWSNLATWGECISSTNDVGIDLTTKASAREAADYLKSIKAIEGNEYSQLAADAWGRAYHWRVSEREGVKQIKIISDGKDGISQDGGGDDLFIEVDVPKQGPVTIRQNKPKRSVFD